MTAVYLVAFVAGAVAVVSALLLAEFSVSSGHGPDGLPFVSLTSVSAALLGAGAGGLIATWADLGGVASGVIAAICAAVLLVSLQAVALPYLRRQQSNSHRGRISYIGLLGTVTLDVPRDGWGEVTFVDADGTRVRARAVTAEPAVLPKSTRVYIADVDAQVVHVVSVPDTHPPTLERP